MKKIKILIPAFAMAFAVIGAFAFTYDNLETEDNGTVIGYYAIPGNPCGGQTECSYGNDFNCSFSAKAFNKAGTQCNVALYRKL